MNNRNRITLLVCAVIIVFKFCVAAAGPESSQQADSTTYALIVSGISKEQEDITDKSQSIAALRAFLLDKAVVTEQNLTILTADNPDNSSNAQNLKKAFNSFAKKVKQGDRFIFYYLGMANAVGENLRFNLPGPDVTGQQLVEYLGQINTSSMLIVLDCPASGLVVRAMSKPGRIVICSCTDEQRYSTSFSRYFIPSLTEQASDSDTNGRISILEAFTEAVRQIDDWYRENELIITETPVLDDNSDGSASKEPWKFQTQADDGFVASQYFLVEKI